jgi:hypothetical protein
MLKRHGLVSFIDGSKSPPKQFTTGSDCSCVPNPSFEAWHQQDQLILTFSSVSPSILSQLVRCETSAAVWCALNQLHSSQSMAKILDLKL